MHPIVPVSPLLKHKLVVFLSCSKFVQNKNSKA